MQPAAWNPAAAAALAAALGADAADVRAEVEAGRCELWHYPPQTWLITRIEDSQAGRVLVLVALAGEGGHAIGRQWIELGRRIGARRVRIHSRRPGMGRYLAPLGFEVAETVYTVSIDHGRQQ